MSDLALEDRKGREIKLVGGTAKKHKNNVGAWIDTGKTPTAHFYHIIVELVDPEDPTKTYLDSCKGKKSNCLEPDPAPSNYVEAAFAQVPKLGMKLTDFVKLAAKCKLTPCRELSDLIRVFLNREITNLLQQGSDAEYRIIDESVLPNVVDEDAMDSH